MIFDCFAKTSQFNNNRQKPCRLLTSLTSNNLKYKTTAIMLKDTVGGVMGKKYSSRVTGCGLWDVFFYSSNKLFTFIL